MRITAEQTANARQRILDAAAELFGVNSYSATTTRDIATAAGIATGTLFNYFATKEAIVSGLAEAALGQARAARPRTVARSLEEELFALVAAELRQLKPHRTYISALLATSLHPLADPNPQETSQMLRAEHLERVAAMARDHGLGELSPVAIQLYWTLYTGVLGFWAADKSPKQEDTLALLDQSLTMFVGWLRSDGGETS
jgi:AcrR family transcriptional regulator